MKTKNVNDLIPLGGVPTQHGGLDYCFNPADDTILETGMDDHGNMVHNVIPVAQLDEDHWLREVIEKALPSKFQAGQKVRWLYGDVGTVFGKIIGPTTRRPGFYDVAVDEADVRHNGLDSVIEVFQDDLHGA